MLGSLAMEILQHITAHLQEFAVSGSQLATDPSQSVHEAAKADSIPDCGFSVYHPEART